jgi:hypothetical protein
VGNLASKSIHTITEGSLTAEFLFNYLRIDETNATKDIGEDASIAFAAIERPEAIFVTADKGAAFCALAELGPSRVATPFDLWGWLRDEQLIRELEFEALCQATLKGDGSLPGIPPRLKR